MHTNLTVSRFELESFLDGAEHAGVGFHATGPALARLIAAEGFDFTQTLGGPLGGGFYLAETRGQALRHWQSGAVLEVAFRLARPASHQDVLRVRPDARSAAGQEPDDAFAWADWTQEWQKQITTLLSREGFDGAEMNTRGGRVTCLYEAADYRLVR